MSLVILCLATIGIVSVATSVLIAVLSVLLRKLSKLAPTASRLAPAAQARILLAGATFPLVASLVLLVTALSPSFGWIRDHYAGELHSHPHLCSAHPISGWPSISLVIVAILVATRLLQTLISSVRALSLSREAIRSMKQASHLGQDGLRILPTDEPQAFVIGLLRPTIYATRGLVSGHAKHHVPAVLAHENAHLRRYDPLRRFVATLGLRFHIPAVARRIDLAHERALEMAADEQAAREVGSKIAVASALVALAKARLQVPTSAFAVVGTRSASDIERRVVQLMDDGTQRDWPSRAALSIAAISVVLIIAIGADTVHHKVELLLGAFGN